MRQAYVIFLEEEDAEWIADEFRTDPIPIVDCQHCKYANKMMLFGKTPLYSCGRKNPAVDVLPTDYCSRGKKIER